MSDDRCMECGLSTAKHAAFCSRFVPERTRTPRASDSKSCAFCAEEIKSAAILCRFCGKDQPKPEARPEQPEPTESEAPQPQPQPQRKARYCPSCARLDIDDRVTCRYCGHDFNSSVDPQRQAQIRKQNKVIGWCLGIAVISAVLNGLYGAVTWYWKTINPEPAKMSASDMRAHQQYQQDQAYKEAYAAREAAERGDFAAMRTTSAMHGQMFKPMKTMVASNA